MSSSTSSSVRTSAGSLRSFTTDLTSLSEILKLFRLVSSLLFANTLSDNSSSLKANSAICNPFMGFKELSLELSFVGVGVRENI